MCRGATRSRLLPMDPMLYFSVFVGGLLMCATAALMFRPPTRPCPSCGLHTPLQARRCRHCEYRFG